MKNAKNIIFHWWNNRKIPKVPSFLSHVVDLRPTFQVPQERLLHRHEAGRVPVQEALHNAHGQIGLGQKQEGGGGGEPIDMYFFSKQVHGLE